MSATDSPVTVRRIQCDALNREIYNGNDAAALPGTLIREEGDPASGDSDGDLAYDYSGDTYNYYLSEHGRDSFDGLGSTLVSKGQFNDYMRLLHQAHREENLETVMCRTLLSVDWQGYVYDCDFNQMLGLALKVDARKRVRLAELAGRDMAGNPIMVRDHCYGCTAGQGSSCAGALA